MGWETFQFGRLYLGGMTPQHIPTSPTEDGDVPDYKEGQGIDIMGTSKEDSITWIKPDGMNLFVADRVLLKNVSWEDLKTAGFIEGKTVGIKGKRYRCRLLQAGNSENIPNEWNNILDTTTENNDLWHWEGMYFWGADSTTNMAAYCALCGYYSARYFYYTLASARDVYLGFRPVLEPLPSDVLDTDELITLEGQKFVMSQLQGTNDRMFYPQLSPIGARPFEGIPEGTEVKMYTVLANGTPVRTDLDAVEELFMPKDTQVTLIDAFYGEEFLTSWVISNGIAVASRALFKYC